MKENSKQERMNPVFAYLVEAVEEFKKVTWPTKEQAIMLTSVVIGVTAVTALFIGLLDLGFAEVYKQVLKYINQSI